jgi:hypothetical protein
VVGVMPDDSSRACAPFRRMFDASSIPRST